MFNLIIFLIFLLTITGCATTSNAPIAGEKSMQNRFGNAIISPLTDLNIVQTAIPVVVEDAVKDPYYTPTDTSCAALADQIHKLDLVLGADLDVTTFQSEKTMAEKGGAMIQNEAVGTIERTISGFIPFRGWLRKLTGAERHAREVESAIAAGIVHRAYLKGIGQARGCDAPAAPAKHPPLNAPVTVPVSDPASNPALIPPATLQSPQLPESPSVPSPVEVNPVTPAVPASPPSSPASTAAAI